MNRWGALTLGILLLAICITLASSVHERTDRKSSRDTRPDHVIRKRNAWWSKKSVDDPRIMSQDLDSPPMDDNAGSALECYTDGCVPDFVECADRRKVSRRFTELLQCKIHLRLCARRCFAESDANIPAI